MKKRQYKGRPLSARRAPPGARRAGPQGAEPQPTVEQISALMAQDIGGVLVALLDAFKISDSPERLSQLLSLLVREQLLIRDQLIPSMTDPARFERQGRIGLKIWPRGQRETASTILLVHKRWEVARQDAQQTFNTAGYLAFLLSPAVRGIVRLVGYDYEFIEPKVAEDERPKIVLVER